MIRNEIFHDAIIESPGDLDARLIYGDWLAEHGDPRGEFIQCQVAMVQFGEWSPEYADLYYRSEALVCQFIDDWNSEIDSVINRFASRYDDRSKLRRTWYRMAPEPNPHFPESVCTYQYHIGFADDFEFTRLPPRDSDLKKLFAVTPVRKIKIRWFSEEDARRIQSDLFRRVREVDVLVRGDINLLKPVIGSKSCLNLEAIRIYMAPQRTYPGQATAASQKQELEREKNELVNMLVRSNALNQLNEFSINADGFGVSDIEKLIAARCFSNLKRLTLVEGSFGDDGMEAIAKSHLAKQLTYLKVKLTSIGDRGFQALADAEPENLHTLALGWWYGTNPTVTGFSALANCPALSNLYHLDLQGWHCEPESVMAFAASPVMSGVRMLNVANTKFGNEKAFILADSPHIELHYLDLTSASISSEGLRSLVHSSVSRNLTWLCLRDCSNIDDRSIQELVSCGSFSQLRYLSLARTKVTAQGVRQLARAANLSCLRELDLSEIAGVERALRDIVDARGLANLQKLHVRSCHIGTAIRQQLEQRFGESIIIDDPS